MSIESVKIAVVFSQDQAQKKPLDATNHYRRSFEQILENSENPLKLNGNSPQKAVAQVRLAQLRMLQGLFFEEEEQTKDPFSGTTDVDPRSLFPLRGSQMIDKYYAAQQPSLLVSEPTERQSIDRMIDQVAEKISLAPELIHSVVSAESAYDPTAISPAGAQGLMQLMPDTARELGVGNSFDPLENLLGGSRYLKQLLEKYAGDIDHALAAYNWGQGNVDRHGLENMPEETRNYLAKIKARLGKGSV